MASASNTLSSNTYNWIKACLAVRITKEGIAPFVYDEIKQFQQKCLADICIKNALLPGSTCNSCHTENVVVCLWDRYCNAGRKKCSNHKYCTRYLPAGCPNQICHNLKNEIQNAHRYQGPSFKNTDATQWCTNPWEVAKCFMPPDGYKDVPSPAETDFNGIINVIINYKDFQAKIKDDLSKKNNIFEKGRTIGKAVRHSPGLEVEDCDLLQYFIDLQNLLSDSKVLAGNNDAQNARTKLTQLQNDTLVIDMKNFQQMLEDVAKVVLHDIKDDLNKESERRKLELINEMKDSVEATGKTSLSKINDALKSAVRKIERKTTDAIVKIETQTQEAALKLESCSKVGTEKFEAKKKHGIKQIDKYVEKGVKKLQTEVDVAVNQIRSLTEEGTFSRNDDQIAEEKYMTLKKELKEDLVYLHRKEHSTIPLSPLFEENDTPLLDFYLMPGMKVVKSKNDIEDNTIQSLSEVYKSEGKFCQEIYITADAGFGKTAFSKYMTVLWCQAHFPDENCKEHFTDENVKSMADFEFIFLVLLRESFDVCSIDDMIYNQVVQNLSRSSSYSEHFLQEILHRERCLVVLDGLDEWNHPDKKCAKLPKSIPHRNARENCSILTTTRPWKLSITKLNTKQIDKKIELTNFDSNSTLVLTMRALKKIKGKAVLEIKSEADKLLKKYYDFEQLSVPLLLMYIICLWRDDIPVEQTKCGLYTSIIELLLSRTISKYENKFQAELTKCVSDIPQCFREQEHCNAHFNFLKSLGELAFQTLLSETKENRLVFDTSIAEKCLKEDFLELGQLTGIITQDKQSKLTSKILKTSFSHKTVQEFFTALYISTCPDQDIVLTKVLSFCKSIQDILDLSKVFIFISGMNAKFFSLLQNELMKVINKDKITSEYRSMTELVYYFFSRQQPLKDIQDMCVSCITEIPTNKDAKTCLQDFFFDVNCGQDNYYTSLKRLVLQNKTNIRSVHLENPGSRSLSEIIVGCELSDPKIHCQKIYCWGRCNEGEIIRMLSTSVKYLYIIGIERDNECKDARSFLTDEQCKTFHDSSQLETFYIENSIVSHEFLNYITNVKSIKDIRLENLLSAEYDSSRSEHNDSWRVFNFDLFQHLELKKLVLKGSNFTLRDINEDESSLLHKMRNIEQLNLWEVKMSSLSLRGLVKILKQLKHSVSVKLFECEITPREEFEDIKDYIRRSERFSVERDGRDDWGFDWFKFVTRK